MWYDNTHMAQSKKLVVTSENRGVNRADAFPISRLVTEKGKAASKRFLEFFIANIRNPNTRQAYARAVRDFLAWCEDSGIDRLDDIEPMHVSLYIERETTIYEAPSVKQHLAAIRMLFDWLVVGQVVPSNPAAAVRGPRHVVIKGKTPVLSAGETRQLIDSLPTDTLTGLRDRALIGLLVYTFARIGAAVGMNVEDVFIQGGRRWVRLHEKGGKEHTMPCHHNLEEYLREYMAAGGLEAETTSPLFRTFRGRSQVLTAERLRANNALDMVRRRTKVAGIETRVTNHTFRATGITTYLKNGGALEKAQVMAAHSSTRTTQLYDRRSDEVSLDEVERILI